MAERTMSATEARVHFGELLDGIAQNGDAVIVERGGQPFAVVISLAEWQRLRHRRDTRWARTMTALEEHWSKLDDNPAALDGVDIEEAIRAGRDERASQIDDSLR